MNADPINEFWMRAYEEYFPFFAGGGPAIGVQTDAYGTPDCTRILYMGGEKIIRIREELQPACYPKLHLEICIDERKQLLGYMNRSDLRTDYVAFGYYGRREVILLDWTLLHRAWLQHRQRWVRRENILKARPAPNQPERIYCAVPLTQLLRAYTECSYCKVREWQTDLLENVAKGRIETKEALELVRAA